MPVKNVKRGVKKSTKRYSKKNSRPVTATALKKIVSKMIYKKAESKLRHADFGKSELYHNLMNIQKMNDTSCMPSQGTGDNQRIGDQINVSGFYIRLLCGQKQDRPNVTWRFVIVKVPKDTSASYNTFFDNVTGNVLLDVVNKDKVQVLKSFTIKKAERLSYFQGNSTGEIKREYTFPVKVWIPYKRTYKFQTDTSVTHTDGDIYLLTFVYDAYGSLTTDNIAYVQTTTSMYYKDL